MNVSNFEVSTKKMLFSTSFTYLLPCYITNVICNRLTAQATILYSYQLSFKESYSQINQFNFAQTVCNSADSFFEPVSDFSLELVERFSHGSDGESPGLQTV